MVNNPPSPAYTKNPLATLRSDHAIMFFVEKKKVILSYLEMFSHKIFFVIVAASKQNTRGLLLPLPDVVERLDKFETFKHPILQFETSS